MTVLIPALAITKTATASTTTPGSTVGFTITVADTGQTPYSGITVTDPLGGVLNDATYDNDAIASSGSVSYASPTLTWTGDLAPGATTTITYSVTVNNPDTGDKRLTNTVMTAATGSNCPAGSTDPACTATVIDLIPALTITKTASVGTTTPGATVGYTVTVADTGQTPYAGAQVTDTLVGVLGDAAYNGDATASAGTVGYASPVLTWTGDLAPGEVVTISYSVTVNDPDTGGRILANTVVSPDPGSDCPAGSTDPRCGVSVPVLAGVLSITAPISANLGSTTPGGSASARPGHRSGHRQPGLRRRLDRDRLVHRVHHGQRDGAGDHPGQRCLLRHHRLRLDHRVGYLQHRTRDESVERPAARRQRHQRGRHDVRHLGSAGRRERARDRYRRPVHGDDRPLRVLTRTGECSVMRSPPRLLRAGQAAHRLGRPAGNLPSPAGVWTAGPGMDAVEDFSPGSPHCQFTTVRI